jgi:membrane carboxypeptidase/penicillin-binding protein
MKAYYRDRSGDPFTEPEGIVHRVVCEDTGLLASAKCKRARREIFVDGTEPGRMCDHCTKEYTLNQTLPNLDDYEDADRQLLDDDDDR